MPSGNASLYLDIYVRGRRTYEYLRLYLRPERSREDREANRQTIKLAEAVRAKRLVEVMSGTYGFGGKGRGADILFADWYAEMGRGRGQTMSEDTRKLWETAGRQLEAYIGSARPRLADIDVAWLQGLQRFLTAKDLKPNTRSVYYSKVCAALNQAEREGLIATNPVRAAGCMKWEETQREYLTLEELRRLADAPCDDRELRRAFLFSCLTGLRRSDIEALTWGDVERLDGMTRIRFRQRKTRGQEYIDIAPEAAELMGAPGEAGAMVFALPANTTVGVHLARWTEKAGIAKHITFHSGRHTFAVMMLDIGTDIYTVSKLLGHRSLATTQIYAKVLDRAKREAVRRIPGVLHAEDGDHDGVAR